MVIDHKQNQERRDELLKQMAEKRKSAMDNHCKSGKKVVQNLLVIDSAKDKLEKRTSVDNLVSRNILG